MQKWSKDVMFCILMGGKIFGFDFKCLFLSTGEVCKSLKSSSGPVLHARLLQT